jgi:hypothetical protein
LNDGWKRRGRRGAEEKLKAEIGKLKVRGEGF